MEMINRYVYAVTRRLPQKQRSDIEKELRGLIEDMLADRAGSRAVSEEDVEAVLLELGSPAELADQYRTKEKYLIGPAIYDTYIFVLKIVLGAVALGITVAITIDYIVTPPGTFLTVVSGYFNALFPALLSGFASVTIIFALFERFDVAIGREEKEKKWSPAALPPLPVKKAIIKPSEAIVGLVFAVLAVIFFNTADHLIGVYSFSQDVPTQVVPLFDHGVFRSVLPLLNIMLAMGITRELLKLAIGKWTRSLAVINLVFNLASFGLFFVFITANGLWNEAFFQFWVDAGAIPADADPSFLWNRVITGFIIVVAFALVLDSIVNLVKGFKYQASNEPAQQNS